MTESEKIKEIQEQHFQKVADIARDTEQDAIKRIIYGK